MANPTYSATYVQSGDFANTNTPLTVSVTVGAGDGIAVIAASSDSAQIPATPTGGGLTYTLQNNQGNNNTTYDNLYVWTALPTSSQTFTMSISISPGNNNPWGFVVIRAANVNQIGAVGGTKNTTTGPSLTFTTQQDHSLVVMGMVDFSSNSSSARTYRTGAGTFTETHHRNTATFGTFNSGYYADSGTAGAKTIGLTAPTYSRWCLVAVEFQGPPPTINADVSSTITSSAVVTATAANAAGISFISEARDSGNFNSTGATKTVSVTANSGDCLVVLACTGDSTQDFGTPSGGGLTYTSRTSAGVNLTNLNGIQFWTAFATSTGSFTLSLSISPNNSTAWGVSVLRFSGVTGIGANSSDSNSSNTTTPLTSFTTTADDSVIVAGSTDWNFNGGARTYRTAAGSFTETNSYANAGIGTLDYGYYADAGVAGTYAIGLTAPTPQRWALIGVELVGAPPSVSADVATTITASTTVSAARADTATVTGAITAAATVTGNRTDTATTTPSVTAAATVTGHRIDAAEITGATTSTTSVTAARSDSAAVTTSTTATATVSATVVGPGDVATTITASGTVTGTRADTAALAATTTAGAVVAATAVGPGVVTAPTTAAASVSGNRIDTASVTGITSATSTVTGHRSDSASVVATVASSASVTATRADTAAVSASTTAAAIVTASIAGSGTVVSTTTAAASVTATRTDHAAVAGVTTASTAVAADRTDHATVSAASYSTALVVAVATVGTTAEVNASIIATALVKATVTERPWPPRAGWVTITYGPRGNVTLTNIARRTDTTLTNIARTDTTVTQ